MKIKFLILTCYCDVRLFMHLPKHQYLQQTSEKIHSLHMTEEFRSSKYYEKELHDIDIHGGDVSSSFSLRMLVLSGHSSSSLIKVMN